MERRITFSLLLVALWGLSLVGCSDGSKEAFAEAPPSEPTSGETSTPSEESPSSVEEVEPPRAETPAGLFVSGEELDEIRDKADRGLEPFSSNMSTLRAKADSALSSEADPFHMGSITSIRFGWCESTDSNDDTLLELRKKIERQSATARDLALYFGFTGDAVYGDHALGMLVDWAEEGSVVNLHDFGVNFAAATFNGMTKDGYCGVRPWNFALDAMWQTYGLINFSDAYLLLTRNGYELSDAADDTVRGFIRELAAAVNSSFHAWTRWADANQKSSSFDRYRSDNHLSWCLAGLLSAGVALGDAALVRYVTHGGAWDDGHSGSYKNPSHIRDLIDRAIEGGSNRGRMYEEKIARDPPIRYALFHLWPMALVARVAQVHAGEDLWAFQGSDSAGLEDAYERYAPYILGTKKSPNPAKEGDLNWYRWLWEPAFLRWENQTFSDVISSGPRDGFVLQSVGPVPLLLGSGDLVADVPIEKTDPETTPPTSEPQEEEEKETPQTEVVETPQEPKTVPEPSDEDIPSGEGYETSSVTSFAITWTFDSNYRVGQYANGDFWVVGPVKVTKVSPEPSGGLNGSMINPRFGDDHGYDKRVLNGYKSSVAVNYPVTLNPNQSLVSTVSWKKGEAGHPSPTATSAQMPDAPRPALKHASVLTCVKTAPPAGSFRPAYTGPKRQHNFNDLRFDLLPQLAPPSGTPNMSTAERYVERVWLDHKPMWNGRYTHPSANMKDYGRDLSSEINDAILMLMLDVPAKERLLVRVVQVGIDLFGVIEDGAHFNYGGGHGIGRKWPIVFAGIMLDDTAMKNVGQSTSAGTFQEDCQTFFITQADKNKFPSIFKTVGEPGWGEWHCTRATDDKSRGYRTCCTANAWHGAALGARIMGAVGVWNWPAFFDYTDGYMAEQLESPDAGRGHWMRSWSGFAEQMWDSHRSKF